MNSTQFEFVGQVTGIKFWSLQLDFLTNMGSSHNLVTGTSPFMCASLK